jgi:hypothetical protein
MSVIVLDCGNSIIKAKISRRVQGEIAFTHAIRQLTESEYEKILSRVSIKGDTKEYFRVNGKPYAAGESAERHGIVTPRSGTARYTKDYCGVLVAISLAKFYERGREVAVFASHPPGDVKYREDLMKSIIGEWEVETGQAKANFQVIYANTFDEPVGGLMNVLLTEDGQHYQYPQIGDGRSLVIDIGSFTTDFLAVNPGGAVDYALARSVPLGIQSIISDFEESFRANNLEIVKNTPVLPPDRVRNAISTGIFVGGGKNHSCECIIRGKTSINSENIVQRFRK